MQTAILYCLLLFPFACSNTKNLKLKSTELNGSWWPVMQEMAGKKLPESILKNQKLIILDTNYTVIAESVDKGRLLYANGRMDITGTEGVNAGKHFNAIYKMENRQLTICYNLAGDGYPKNFQTSGSPLLFLSIFRKE